MGQTIERQPTATAALETAGESGLRHAAVALAGFLALLGTLWILFYIIWRGLPYIQPGADLIRAAKLDLANRGAVFPPEVSSSERMLVVGNSAMLAGFLPRQFDGLIAEDAGTKVHSFNFGLPDYEFFTKQDLGNLVLKDQAPQRILLQLRWNPAPEETTPFHFLFDDDGIMNDLLPFRKLPRNLALFTLRASSFGGPAAFYRYAAISVGKMVEDRGWYFIEGQSHYPGNRLPDDFHLESDTPAHIADSGFIPTGAEFAGINDWAKQYNIRIYLIPGYFRIGAQGAPPQSVNTSAARMTPYSQFTAVAPNYFLYPNRYFSDPVHLNAEGARVYTAELAHVMANVLRNERTAAIH